MAEKISIKFRVGPQISTPGSSKSPSDITSEVTRLLTSKIKKVGLDNLFAAVLIEKEMILREIRIDANRFAENAAKVMTRVRSPIQGSVLVSVDDVNRNFVGSTTFEQFREGNRLLEGGHTVVSWSALTARTLANKRNRGQRAGPRGAPETFFVDSGQLRSLLITYLGPAFANLIDPQIIFNRYEEKNKVTVTLITMAKNIGFAKRLVGRENLPFLNTAQHGNAASSSTETVLVSYLQSAGARDPNLAAKLTNPRGQQRPFLQPVLSYWFLNRLPIVLERSLLKAMKTKSFVSRTSNIPTR